MNHIQKFESFITKDIIPPINIDNDDNGGDDGDKEFRYDFKITGMLFKIKTNISIKKELDILNYDSNKIYINKYKIATGYICMNINNFYSNSTEHFLSIDVYYSSDIPVKYGRLKLNDIVPEVKRIIYETLEYQFEYLSTLGYEHWDKMAWLSIE